MSKKLTPWYPGHIKPVRVGVYQQRSGGFIRAIGYQWWDGKHWSAWFAKADAAAKYGPTGAHADACWQTDQWRGLAQEPKA